MLPLPSIEERVEVCRTHAHKSVEWKGEVLGILEMRRHYSNYLKGLPHVKDFRTRLVTVKTLAEVDGILNEIKEKFTGIILERQVIPLTEDQLPACAC
jgi:tRNA-dihydrouridine synthase